MPSRCLPPRRRPVRPRCSACCSTAGVREDNSWAGPCARGPLAAFADILIAMQVPSGDRFIRRRHFHGVGRHPGTLQHVTAELNAEGTDYLLLPDAPPDAALAPALETLRQLLSQSTAPLTRQELLARWPESERPPRADSLWRCLTRGCERGLLVRTGAGTRAEAFRYGLAQGEPAA